MRIWFFLFHLDMDRNLSNEFAFMQKYISVYIFYVHNSCEKTIFMYIKIANKQLLCT